MHKRGRPAEEEKLRKAVEAEEAVGNMPVRITVGKYVYARPVRKLSEEEVKKVDEALGRLGFRYVERWNAWIY